MIEFIFTLDYEIYGNGQGNLKECIICPAEGLLGLFNKFGYRLVIFPEVLELEKIMEYKTDPDISRIGSQLRKIHKEGHEIGLHVHSWWARAYYQNNRWQFDLGESNLCSLTGQRIQEILGHGLCFLRNILNDGSYQPVSFRNGLWTMQPTRNMAIVLNRFNLRLDSTVFKGGLIKKYGVDYRPSLKNGYYWKFLDDVNRHQDDGVLLEIPIYTELVPFWKMFSRFLTKTSIRSDQNDSQKWGKEIRNSWSRAKDYMRLWYPRKLDFCFMSSKEIISLFRKILELDKKTKELYKPIVLVGHTKNLLDLKKVEIILRFIKESGIEITTFKRALDRIFL